MKKTTLLKSMLLLCALIVGSNSLWADISTLTFTAACGGSGTADDGAEWTVTSDAAESTWDSSRGIHYGTGSKAVQYITLTTDDIVGTITKIVVNASGSNSPTLSAKVNGSSFDDAQTGITTSNAAYTFTGSATGAIEIDLRKSSKANGALYVKSIAVTYTASSGEITTTTIDASGVKTNIFVGTDGGSFSASVKYGSPASDVPEASVTWTSSDTDVATINATTGAVTLVATGTTTITASYAGVDDEYLPSDAEYELTVINEDPNAVTLWNEDFSSYSANDVPSGDDYGEGFNYTCVDGGSDTKIYAETLAGGTSPELLVGKSTGHFEAVVPLQNIRGNLQLKYKTNANALTISTSTKDISISGADSYSTEGEHTVTFTGVTTDMTSITIKFAATGSKNVRLDDIMLKGSKVAPVTIGSTGWSTYSNSDALDFANAEPSNPASDALEAYMITGFSGSALTKSDALDNVPGNTGLLLKGTAGETYNIPVLLSSSTSTTGNCLQASVSGGTVSAGEGTNVNYVLMNVGGSPVFQWIGTTSATLGANKAYLTLVNGPKSAGARGLWFDDETTGLNKVEMNNSKTNGVFYNLAGQRVTQPSKGLYIVNGKKVVVK